MRQRALIAAGRAMLNAGRKRWLARSFQIVAGIHVLDTPCLIYSGELPAFNLREQLFRAAMRRSQQAQSLEAQAQMCMNGTRFGALTVAEREEMERTVGHLSVEELEAIVNGEAVLTNSCSNDHVGVDTSYAAIERQSVTWTEDLTNSRGSDSLAIPSAAG